MTGASRPWWASLEGPSGGAGTDRWSTGEQDPVEAFRASRRPRDDRADMPGATGPGPTGPGSADERSGAATAEPGSTQDTGSLHRPEVCGICPLCTLARSLEDTRPELLEHLTEAVRHLAAAARTLLEPPAGAAGGAPGPTGTAGVQHIDLDDRGGPEPGGGG